MGKGIMSKGLVEGTHGRTATAAASGGVRVGVREREAVGEEAGVVVAVDLVGGRSRDGRDLGEMSEERDGCG